MNAPGTGKTGSTKTSSWPPQKEPPRHLSFNLGQGRWRTSGRACAGAVVPRRHLPVNETGYLIVVTRGHRDDMRVLRWAVSTNARYIAMIGSKRKVIINVIKELEKEGIARESFTRVFAPMGLEIGSVSPEEIAVSVVAEMIAVRRNADSDWRALSKSVFCWRVPAGAVAQVTCGLILAAGESRRMGSPKALLEFRGETFLDRLIGLFSRRCSPVIAVLGTQHEIVRAGLRRAGEALLVQNRTFASASLHRCNAVCARCPPMRTVCCSPWWIIPPWRTPPSPH
jgi:hypothetical protein